MTAHTHRMSTPQVTTQGTALHVTEAHLIPEPSLAMALGTCSAYAAAVLGTMWSPVHHNDHFLPSLDMKGGDTEGYLAVTWSHVK